MLRDVGSFRRFSCGKTPSASPRVSASERTKSRRPLRRQAPASRRPRGGAEPRWARRDARGVTRGRRAGAVAAAHQERAADEAIATTGRTHGTMLFLDLRVNARKIGGSTSSREEDGPMMKVGFVAAVVGVLIVGTGWAQVSTCQQQAKSDYLACKNQCKSDFIDARFACKNINPRCGVACLDGRDACFE